jgi:UDP-N-acetyl-D-glucosamine dehydrogenase
MRHYDVPRLASESLTPDYLSSQDCVVAATDHSAYDWSFIVRHAPIVVDTRNVTSTVENPRATIYKA